MTCNEWKKHNQRLHFLLSYFLCSLNKEATRLGRRLQNVNQGSTGHLVLTCFQHRALKIFSILGAEISAQTVSQHMQVYLDVHYCYEKSLMLSEFQRLAWFGFSNVSCYCTQALQCPALEHTNRLSARDTKPQYSLDSGSGWDVGLWGCSTAAYTRTGAPR